MAGPSGSDGILRFGIMSDSGLRFAKWQVECIQQLMALPRVRPALIIQNATPVTSSPAARLGRAKPHLILGQIARNLLSRPHSLQTADLSGLLGAVPSISCMVTQKGRFSQYFSDEDVAAIRRHDLAFILRFGFNIIRGEILHAARYGVWSFHHGDNQKYRGVSEGFWEIARGEAVAGAILQRLTEALDAGVVLRKGHFAVVGHSWTKTRDVLHLESARWPAQVCTDILNGVADYVNAQPTSTTAPIFPRPTNLQTLRFGWTLLRNAVRYFFDRTFVQTTWGLGVIEGSAERLLTSPRPATRYVADSSAGYRFLADPFVVAVRPPDTVCILCEEYDHWTRNRGRIVYAELTNGAVSRLSPALPLSHHASYPCIVHHEGNLFCVPETPAAGCISLYRSVDFPAEWVLERVLVEGFSAADPTVFQHGGRWWLAACCTTDGPYHNLFLWHADSLFGPWQPHPGNPVKSDVRSARPAGPPFTSNGSLYRPAQDCSDGYGRRISINRVERLTPLAFSESVVAVLEPDQEGPFLDGMHTLASAEGYTVIDGRHDFFDPFKQIKKQLLARIIRWHRRQDLG